MSQQYFALLFLLATVVFSSIALVAERIVLKQMRIWRFSHVGVLRLGRRAFYPAALSTLLYVSFSVAHAAPPLPAVIPLMVGITLVREQKLLLIGEYRRAIQRTTLPGLVLFCALYASTEPLPLGLRLTYAMLGGLAAFAFRQIDATRAWQDWEELRD